MAVIDLWSICENNNLNNEQSGRFCTFVKLWRSNWNEMDVDYMDEWASRFKKKCEYVRADRNTRKFLVKIDGLSSIDRCKEQYKNLDWCNKSIAKEVKEICELISDGET